MLLREAERVHADKGRFRRVVLEREAPGEPYTVGVVAGRCGTKGRYRAVAACQEYNQALLAYADQLALAASDGFAPPSGMEARGRPPRLTGPTRLAGGASISPVVF